MKITFVLALLLLLIGCSKEGEITNRSQNHIIIDGKEYYFIKVIPADGERGVWLLIPKGQDVEIPRTLSYTYTTSCGKNCTTTRTVESIWIKS